MFDKDFLIRLEYDMSYALQKADEKYKRSYWCDGILLPDSGAEYSQKEINDKREVTLRAVIPKEQYENKDYWWNLILKFGECSLRRYAKGKRLEKCIPDIENDDWIELDVENKIVVVRLK